VSDAHSREHTCNTGHSSFNTAYKGKELSYSRSSGAHGQTQVGERQLAYRASKGESQMPGLDFIKINRH
jgi:hypothetical protein